MQNTTVAETPATAIKTPEDAIGMRDKLAYATGDLGCTMSAALKSYLSIYWTQYMGIDSYLMSGLLLVVQVWDAINDPLLGSVIDRDRHVYRRNKFLQYIFVGSIGLVIAGALCFMPAPNAPTLVKGVMLVSGYIIWDAFYTMVNVPYGSMMSLISADPEERSQLSLWRSVGSMGGGLITGMLVPVLIYDAADNLRGSWMFGMALAFGLMGFALLQFTVRNTKIRVAADEGASRDAVKFSFTGAVRNFTRNRAVVGASVASFGQCIGVYGAATAQQIMFQSYFSAAQLSGVFTMISYLGVFLFMPLLPTFVARWGKKRTCAVGAITAMICYALMAILPIPRNVFGVAIMSVCMLGATFASASGTCLNWSFVADAIDYNEWKFGVRDEGTTYALSSFCRKLAQGVAPSAGLALATYLGYTASLGAAQTAATALNMRYLVAGINVVSAIIQFIGYGLIFNLDEATTRQMNAELAERRAR